jgi:hypothetical protein
MLFPSGLMHSPVLETQSEKSQSLNLDGGLKVLATSNSFRTRLTAQILVNKISVIFSLKTAHVLSNSCVNSRFCSSFSFISSVSALMLEIVFAWYTGLCASNGLQHQQGYLGH